MKVKPASKRGKVRIELNRNDDGLLEKHAVGRAPVQLKKILVPIDFSEFSTKALDYALAFAEQFQASVVLVHVVEPAVYPETYMLVPPALQEMNQDLVKAGAKRLDKLSQERIADGILAQTQVRLGRPHFEICEAAKSLQADLIIIATHGYTGLKHVLLGSTAERVVRHAPCPVLTVRAPEHEFVPTAS